LTLKVNELDIVLLKNGRRGTVVHVYELPLGRLPAYVVELLPGDGDLVTVEHGEVAEVLDPFIPQGRIMVKLALSPRQKALWRERNKRDGSFCFTRHRTTSRTVLFGLIQCVCLT